MPMVLAPYSLAVDNLMGLAGVRNTNHDRGRIALPRADLHQMGIGQRFCVHADAHEPDVKILGNGAGRADAGNENAGSLTENRCGAVNFIKVEQTQRALQRVNVARKDIFCDGLHRVVFREIFENRVNSFGCILGKQQLHLCKAGASNQLAKSNNTRFRDV